mmetsp:Transcript_106533/g.301290  ORF Transcript_106533/g.301290 Transcript_106533/m.301290 type:complete len:132 (-) Transcript_106533:73-468(-)
MFVAPAPAGARSVSKTASGRSRTKSKEVPVRRPSKAAAMVMQDDPEAKQCGIPGTAPRQPAALAGEGPSQRRSSKTTVFPPKSRMSSKASTVSTISEEVREVDVVEGPVATEERLPALTRSGQGLPPHHGS